MIVDHTSIDEQIAVPQMAALEADLFGRGAWSEQSIRQEFQAPARTYLFDIDDDGKTAVAGLRVALPWMSRLLDRLQAILLDNSPLCAAMPVSGMTATMRKS